MNNSSEVHELKILGKIDLSKIPDNHHKNGHPKTPEAPESSWELYSEKINVKLGEMAAEINSEHGNFLDESAAVDMEAYRGRDLGRFNWEVEKDQEYIAGLEFKFSRKKDLEIEEWRAEREKQPGVVAEKLITLVLHKILKERFIIARASTYDDYRHKVDNLMIDRETGAVICGFDDVQAGDNFNSEKFGLENKGSKIFDGLPYGGAKIKYGATMENGSLVKRPIYNVPGFFLAASNEDLESLAQNLDNPEISTEEADIFRRFVNSIKDQLKTVYKEQMDKIDVKDEDFKLNNLRQNLRRFQDSLVVLEEISKNLKNN